MRIEAFILAWNEQDTIALTLKHYQKFCDKITLFDNYSDDDTPLIARAMGCEVKQFGIKGVLDDREYTKLKNNCWKGSDADWVIVVDADEILVLPASIVNEYTVLKPVGLQVYSHKLPAQDWSELTYYYPDDQYSKLCMFRPNKIDAINYVHGCHVAKPIGDVKIGNVGFLMHYRNAGGPDRLIARHAQYRARMSDWNKKWNAGVHYTYDDDRRRREWEEQYDRALSYSRGLGYG